MTVLPDAGNKESAPKTKPTHNSVKKSNPLLGLMLAALGIVFGDIGTSPIYALRECFHGEYGIAVTSDNILGVLSLMFWALIIIVSVKYLIFIFKADNNGEGGVIALTSLIQKRKSSTTKRRLILISVGIFAASLLYGDGMITPAISVLSATEGLRVLTPAFEPYIIPATIIILAGLFLLQQWGTARVGLLFGPFIMIWFIILALLGLFQLIHAPHVLASLLPWYGIKFLIYNRLHGFIVLGAVFLVVTGAEALYADIGHFGKRPIRLVWIALVFPALLLNYMGQGALLLLHPEEAHHPFFVMAPGWATIPLVILATIATIIASQAVITGAFSLTRQAVQLGFLPRLRIIHTSSKHIGQIYVPIVNWILMVATIALVLGFQSSSKLAAAYGVAVTSTMLITTMLFYVVAREKWGWSRLSAGLPVALFFIVDLSFFGANLGKIMHGAWFPLVIGAIVFFIIMTWRQGREVLAEQFRSGTMAFSDFQKMIEENPPKQVNGQAIFLTGNPTAVPTTLLHNLTHNKVIHSQTAFLHFKTEDVPRVANENKVEFEKLGKGFYRIIAHYGFMESPNIPNIISLIREQGLEFKAEKISYFLGRERLIPDRDTGMVFWRARIFAFMSRNALDPAAFYDIPSEQLIEVGIQLKV